MTELRQAAEKALEALGKWSSGKDMDAVELNDLIFMLESALEQPTDIEAKSQWLPEQLIGGVNDRAHPVEHLKPSTRSRAKREQPVFDCPV